MTIQILVTCLFANGPTRFTNQVKNEVFNIVIFVTFSYIIGKHQTVNIVRVMIFL